MRWLGLAFVVALVACDGRVGEAANSFDAGFDSGPDTRDGGQPRADGGEASPDASTSADAGATTDSGPGDAGTPDAATPLDAGPGDAGIPDAATPLDGGPGDAGGTSDAATPLDAGGSDGAVAFYATSFGTPENPLSENGVWTSQPDSFQTPVKTEVLAGVHVAHGTQVVSGPAAPYDDSQAHLAAFPKNHTIEATVWKSSTIASSPNAEVELLLSWRSDGPQHDTMYGPTHSTGYEININQNGDYLILGQFKGAALSRAVSPPKPQTGDVFKARFVDNGDGTATITMWWNGVLLPFTNGNPYTDLSPPPSGFPGIGFYVDPGIANDGYGFSSVVATSP